MQNLFKVMTAIKGIWNIHNFIIDRFNYVYLGNFSSLHDIIYFFFLFLIVRKTIAQLPRGKLQSHCMHRIFSREIQLRAKKKPQITNEAL